MVDIASDSSKQAQLEVNYLLASRSLVKCLLVSCGLDPFMRFYLVLYPIDCDREIRERETLLLYIPNCIGSIPIHICYHLSSLLWLADFPVFFGLSRHQLASSSPHHPLVVPPPPEGLLGPSGCRSRHRLPGLESQHGRASERLPGLCAVGTPGHVAR